jgi:RsiW-degrading membrane proteinase PrsW (M82 family)
MTDPSWGFALRALGIVVAAALFWLMYLDLKDPLRPEPRRMLGAAVALGACASGLAHGAYRGLEAVGVVLPLGGATGALALYCLLVIGPVEEGAKFFVTRWVLLRSRHFDEHVDGLVYPGAVAIGFAATESVLLASGHTLSEQLARAVVGPAVHSVFAMLWGYGLAHARFAASTPRARLLWQVLPLGAAMLLHGLYDLAIIGFGATLPAGVLFAVLWLAMVLGARRLLAMDRARHAGMGTGVARHGLERKPRG